MYFFTMVTSVLFFSCKEKKTAELDKPKEEPIAVNYLEESEEDFNKRMNWWRDAQFGMFIHWGPYSVAGGEYKGETIAGWVGAEWIMNDGEMMVKFH